MAIPLPSALTNFSQSALKNIESLSSIQKTIQDPIAKVQKNIKEVAAEAVTQPGDILETVPSFAEESVGKFQGDLTGPKAFDVGAQQEAFKGIYGTGATGGASVDGFLATDVKLQDIIPAQQLFKTIQNLGGNALYVDPLQAYAHVTSGAADISNLCREATSLISGIQADVTQLLSLQTAIDYVAIKGMDTAFFKNAQSQLKRVTDKYEVLKAGFEKTGKYDPIVKNELCTLITLMSKYMLLDDPAPLEYDIVRKRINERVQRLREILRALPEAISGAGNFVPSYVASAVGGKLFGAVQEAVLQQTGVSLDRISRDIGALVSLSADDRAKLLANWAIGGTLESIRAYICQIDPSNDVVDLGDPVIGPLKTEYDTMSSGFAANDLTPYIESLESEIGKFTATMQTCVTRDAGAELTSSAGTITGNLASMSAALLAICALSDSFRTVFSDQVSLVGEDRAVGALDILADNGLGAARDIGMTESFDGITDIPLSESTKPGELAQSIRQRISELPDGNEKDQLTALYSEVNARHRATVLAMDLNSRVSAEAFLAPDEAEANRQLVNKTTKVYSGLPPGSFDRVTTT